MIKGAKTDSDRHITFDPEHRPEVSNLVQIITLCEGSDPHVVAEEIGDGGAVELKRRLTEALNEHFAPIRRSRLELAADPAQVWRTLREGCERAEAIVERTLDELREAMGMKYF